MGNQAELPEELRKVIGSEEDRGWGADEVCRPMIRHWCEALDDRNPLYVDERCAIEMGYDRIPAPPTMLFTFGQGTVSPEAVQRNFRWDRIPLGTPESIVQSSEWEFFAPILVGDRLRVVEKIVSISPQKVTRVGTGHFVTWARLHYDQHGTLVGTLSFTVFTYQPQEKVDLSKQRVNSRDCNLA